MHRGTELLERWCAAWRLPNRSLLAVARYDSLLPFRLDGHLARLADPGAIIAKLRRIRKDYEDRYPLGPVVVDVVGIGADLARLIDAGQGSSGAAFEVADIAASILRPVRSAAGCICRRTEAKRWDLEQRGSARSMMTKCIAIWVWPPRQALWSSISRSAIPTRIRASKHENARRPGPARHSRARDNHFIVRGRCRSGPPPWHWFDIGL